MTQPSNPTNSALETIASGLAENAGHRTSDAKRAQRMAADFRPNDNYERLIAMRTDDPARFEQLGHAAHIAIGLYEGQKEVHATVTTEGNAS